jgi:hypothetical protein
MHVDYYNVGQGDCIVLEEGSSRVLIDGGTAGAMAPHRSELDD